MIPCGACPHRFASIPAYDRHFSRPVIEPTGELYVVCLEPPDVGMKLGDGVWTYREWRT